MLLNLTANQKLAVESIDKPTAIIAGAGSGKTEVLTSRLKFILNEGNTSLNQILAVTFTEKAAGEMKRRVAKGLNPEKRKELPWAAIETFHGFCLNVLKEHAPLLGLSNFLSVWDQHAAQLSIHRNCRAALLKELEKKNEAALFLVEEMEFKNVLLLLQELMSYRWHWRRIRTRDQRLETRDLKEGKLFEATETLYDLALTNYEEEKSSRQAVDFQDLEILTLKLFQENKEVLKNCQSRFKHILVDEAQDINDIQQELIRLLFAPQKNVLCLVGDPKQSIYRFRGANTEGFKKMIAWIVQSGGIKIELNENFRSRPGILRWVNHTFANLFDPSEFAALTATRPSLNHEALVILPVQEGKVMEERRKNEARAITQYIQKEVASKNASYGDFALLFQSLTELPLYEEVFKEAQIPARIFGGRGFLHAQEVLDGLFVLKVLSDPSNRLALVGLMRSPLIGFPDAQITEMCLDHTDHLMASLLQTKEAAWLKELFESKIILSGAEILEQAILYTDYDLILDQLDPSGGKSANIEQLIQLVRELETTEGLTLKNLLEYFDALKERRARLSLAPAVDTVAAEAVQIMTVHQAKGLEFPIVILPDLIRSQPPGNHRYLFARNEGLGFYLRENESPFGGFVPSETVSALIEKEKFLDLNERKRLLYVAMTRAKEKLILPMHETLSKAGLWHGWIKEGLSHYDALSDRD